MKALGLENEIECLSSACKGQNDKLAWKCKFGHEWMASFIQIKAWGWCRRCAEKPNFCKEERLKEAHLKALDFKGQCLSSDYKDNKKKLKFRCEKGHEFEKSFAKLMGCKSFCGRCTKKNENGFTEESFKSYVGKRKGVVLGEWRGSNELTQIECENGHVWESKPRGLMLGEAWCRECAKGRNGERLSYERILAAIEKKKGKCLSEKGDIKNQKSMIQVACHKGHIWKTTAFSLIYSESWCPDCAGSQGETMTVEFVKKMTGLSFKKVRPEWLRSTKGYSMELDAYCEEQKFAIEYQGEQHYQFMPLWHRTQTAFKEAKARDALKRKLCKEQGVTLLEVRFVKQPTPEKIAKQVEAAAAKAGIALEINPEYRAWLDAVKAGSKLPFQPSKSASLKTKAPKRR